MFRYLKTGLLAVMSVPSLVILVLIDLIGFMLTFPKDAWRAVTDKNTWRNPDDFETEEHK